MQNGIYCYDGKYTIIYSAAITPALSVTSEIILKCWYGSHETLIIIISVKKVELLNIFMETMIFFKIHWWTKFKGTAFI